MKFVMVDISVWSKALRKNKLSEDDKRLIGYLEQLVRDGRVIMIGAIRQEILCGISDETRFEKLRRALEAFSDFELEEDDYITAASFYNKCRSKGIQGSITDFLICAVAMHHNFSILTLDNDFELYSRYIELDLVKESDWQRGSSNRKNLLS